MGGFVKNNAQNVRRRADKQRFRRCRRVPQSVLFSPSQFVFRSGMVSAVAFRRFICGCRPPCFSRSITPKRPPDKHCGCHLPVCPPVGGAVNPIARRDRDAPRWVNLPTNSSEDPKVATGRLFPGPTGKRETARPVTTLYPLRRHCRHQQPSSKELMAVASLERK